MNRDWDKELEQENEVNSMWEKIKQILDTGVKTCVPTVQVIGIGACVKQRVPLPEPVREQIRLKNSLWKKYLRGEVEERAYKKQRNKVRNAVRRHVRKQQNKVALEVKSNPKKFWAYVNNKTKMKDKIGELEIIGMNGQQKIAVNDQDKAEALNSFFSSVFTREPDEEFEEMVLGKPVIQPMVDIEISLQEVQEKLKKINVNKSSGPDEIHPRILYEVRNELAYPLVKLYNLSLKSEEIPRDWQSANITAVYKKGKKSLVSYYRPISLTCILCKIMESIIRDRVMAYFFDNGLFSDRQFGFLKGRSTVIQLLQILDHWTELLETGGRIDVIYTDLEKAFDKVPHQRLLSKLQTYGIHEKAINWIKAFLTNRRQRVKINDALSDWEEVLSGIPQGSVLGPLLFIIYINDLVEQCENGANIYLFADDAKIYKYVSKLEDKVALQQSVNNFMKWTDRWLVKVNVNKCKVMMFSNRPNVTVGMEADYMMGQNQLENVDSIKDLGVTFDVKLRFSDHINDKVNKAYGMLGVIKRNFGCMSRNCLIMLYKAMVRAHLEYANNVWNPLKKGDVENLEKVQKRFTKMIKDVAELKYPERLKRLKLPTLVYRRTRGDMIEMFKLITGKYDSCCMPGLRLYFADTALEGRETRGHRYKLRQRHCTYNLRQHYFINRSVPIWNGLPDSVVSAGNINVFKSRLDKFWSNQDFLYNYMAQPEGTGSRSTKVYIE